MSRKKTRKKNDSLLQNVDPAMLLCTFRYALGRKTMIVPRCVEWLEEYWDKMPLGYKDQIKKDITFAIEKEMAGDQCDIVSWERVLKLHIEGEDNASEQDNKESDGGERQVQRRSTRNRKTKV